MVVEACSIIHTEGPLSLNRVGQGQILLNSVELVVNITVAALALGVGAVALTVPLVTPARLAVLAVAQNVLLFLVRH